MMHNGCDPERRGGSTRSRSDAVWTTNSPCSTAARTMTMFLPRDMSDDEKTLAAHQLVGRHAIGIKHLALDDA